MAALAALLLSLPAAAAGQATALTPYGSVQAGVASDDSNTPVPLTAVFPTGVNFGGTVYTQLYIGSNGYITFGHGNSGFNPAGIAGYSQGPIVAAQFDDLNPSVAGDIWYHQNTASGYVVVTFDGVAPYRSPTGAGSGVNTFQIVLRKVAQAEDFQIELRYVDLDWARSGNIVGWPTAGWSAGDQATYSELPQSGTSAFLDIEGGSNVGQAGVYRWDVTGGVVNSVPNVSATTAATSITGTSATSGGTVLSDGGLTVTGRGVAYGTSTGPTVSGTTASGGSGTGTFTADLTGLTPGTTYYHRAYATNALGTDYGPERSFTTPATAPPTVTTAAASSVTASSATVGGNVTSDGGASVTVRGIAWGTSPTPTLAGDTLVGGSGTGAFTRTLSGLDPGTTYYARAFAINSQGAAYGSQRSFTTEKLAQSIDFTAIPDLAYGAEPVLLTATATSGLPVSFGTSDAGIAEISGDTLFVRGAGTVTITASQAGDATYQAAPDRTQEVSVGALGVEGFFQVVPQRGYDGTRVVEVTDRSLEGLLPEDTARVWLHGGVARFADPDVGSDKPVQLEGATLQGPSADRYTLTAVHPTTSSVVPGPPDRVTLDGETDVEAAGAGSEFTLVVRDAWGHPTPVGRATTFALATSAPHADAVFLPDSILTLEPGQTMAAFTYLTARVPTGPQELTASRLAGASLPGGSAGSHGLTVEAPELAGFRIEAVGGGDVGVQVAGIPFRVRVTAVDGDGKRVDGFEGSVAFASEARLASGGASATFEDGVLASHEISLDDAGRHVLTATETGGSASGTSNVFLVVMPGGQVGLELTSSDPRPAVGDTVVLVLTATNWGTAPAVDTRITSPLTGQVQLQAVEAATDQGTFDPDAGTWVVPRLEPGSEATLRITAVVVIPDEPPAAAGSGGGAGANRTGGTEGER